MYGLWFTFKPGQDLALFQILNGLSFLIVGITLLLIIKPSLNSLSLNLDYKEKNRDDLHYWWNNPFNIDIYTIYLFIWTGYTCTGPYIRFNSSSI